MTDITPEMIAAGAAIFEEYAGGDYLRWRQAAVRAWIEMSRAKDGEEPTGGETFMLAYKRNMAQAKELADRAGQARQSRAAREAAAREHGLALPADDPNAAAAEREWQEWQEWLSLNG